MLLMRTPLYTTMDYRKSMELARAEKNKFFREHAQSPLTPAQQRKFVALEYFPINEEYNLQLKIHYNKAKEVVWIQTNDQQIREYFKYGYFEFEVEGNKGKVYVYRSNEHPDYYFIPFKDATSGTETYGAGRYLDAIPIGNEEFVLDFNKAYNPYCAYNGNYSCPIPPEENWLDIPIRAGEKTYPDPEY